MRAWQHLATISIRRRNETPNETTRRGVRRCVLGHAGYRGVVVCVDIGCLVVMVTARMVVLLVEAFVFGFGVATLLVLWLTR